MRPISASLALLVPLTACAVEPDAEHVEQPLATYHVYVDASGQFSPRWLHVRQGDTVTWHLADRNDSIVSRDWPSMSSWPAICSGPATPADAGFAGPDVVGASGVHVMGAKDEATDNGVWVHPEVSGVFIRMSWDKVDGGPDWAVRYTAGDWPVNQRYDWRHLDGEMDRAVANGKHFSLGVKAGRFGTPSWLDLVGAPRWLFADNPDPDTGTCGAQMWLGDPTAPAYQVAYNEMLTALGAHVRSNNAWYRALAYVRLSGANLDTHENKLPSSCQLPCICNTSQWSAIGYTPRGLSDFYAAQANTIAAAFPGKTMSYMLIQDGFPLVNDDGDYLSQIGPLDINGDGAAVLPDPIDQTWDIIRRLQDEHGERVHVQHNGLTTGPAPDYVPHTDEFPYFLYFPFRVGHCRYDGVHPVGGTPYDLAGHGCPNPWVLRSGWRSASAAVPWVTLTGFQMMNDSNGPANQQQIDQALQNAYDSSDAVLVEIYAERLAEIAHGEVLDPAGSGLTLGAWDEAFAARRRAVAGLSPALPDPWPTTFSHTFEDATAYPHLNYYVHGAKCGWDDPAHAGTEYQYGVVVIDP